MKLVRISKMSPDPSEVHVLGGGKVARKVRRPKFKAAVHKAWHPRKPVPKKPELATLFDDSPQAHLLKMQKASAKSMKKRASAAEMRRKAFGQDKP
jgi:hypothetical protein